MGNECFYCRIITDEYSEEVRREVVRYFISVFGINDVSNIRFSNLRPYWKIDGRGEMDCQFNVTGISLASLQQLFADKWENNTADVKFSNIRCPHTVFFWLENE